MVAIGGVMAIDTSAAAVTVNCVDPLTVPVVAVTVAVPCPRPCARPPLLWIVTAVGVSEDHVTTDVRFCVLWSVYVPVAVNCRLDPIAIDTSDGVTTIDTSAAALTVTCVLPLVDPDVAVMLALPVPSLLNNPGVVVLIIPTPGVSELQCAMLVMSCVVPSVKLPVAVNCCVVPNGTIGIPGVTAIETTAAGFTVTVVDPLIVPIVAVTVVLPIPALLAIPWPLIVATAGSAVFQVAVVVSTSVLPSL
jgi:hypothetical protein